MTPFIILPSELGSKPNPPTFVILGKLLDFSAVFFFSYLGNWNVNERMPSHNTWKIIAIVSILSFCCCLHCYCASQL